MNERRSTNLSITRIVRRGWIFFCLLFVAACHLDMYDQPKLNPYEESRLFQDNAGSRPVPPDTVSRSASLDTVLTTGKEGDQFIAKGPLAVDDTLLARGKERYAIYCVTCHGANLNGKGPVASYFKPGPASFYAERLRNAPDGYLFNVVTWGKGQMYPLAANLSPEDRWAIIAYIRQTINDGLAAPPEGVEVNPTEVPADQRLPGTVQPNQPELP